MQRVFIVTCAVFLGLLIGCTALWETALKRHHLSFIPPSMPVESILYVAEEAWGFGPGGNETGIIVYAMPPSVRLSLEQSGTTWLQALPPPANSYEWHGRYENWYTTPTPMARFHWVDRATCPPDSEDRYRTLYPAGCPSVAGYMDNYGFGIPFDPEVEKIVNAALREPGSFYAFGRIGMLILIPARDLIVYVYNG